jgi:fructokinase
MKLSQRNLAIGIDLGGTKTEVIILSEEDAVLFRERKATPRHDGYEAIVNSVAEMIGHAAGHLPPNTPYSVGIGIPGSVYETTGLISILDPDAVILGGELSNIDELYTTGI